MRLPSRDRDLTGGFMRFRTFASIAVLAGALLSLSGGAVMAAGTDGVVEGSVPPAIAVPPGHALIADMLGVGVQVYQCTAGAWVFVEPAANLVGWVKRPDNVATAVHFRGPSWQSTNDGSLVEARVIASVPVAGSIPQLLLQSTRNRGDGAFGNVSFLQRLNTRGGLAPAGSCADGQTVGVPYRATYRFFVPVR
jgi:hypothetical protein